MPKKQMKLKQANPMTLEDIASLQSVYSPLYLSGQVSDETYRSVVNATMLSLNGFTSTNLEFLAQDLGTLHELTELMEKIKPNEEP